MTFSTSDNLIFRILNCCSDPLVGGGTIYSNGVFLFSQFWPIDIFIVEKCERYH